MKTNIKLLSIFLLAVILSNLVSASILDQHTNIGEKALENTKNSPITQEIMPYKDYYSACNEYVDISIVDYISLEKNIGFWNQIKNILTLNIGIGAKYKATHSLSALQRALKVAGSNSKLRSCAWGIGSHLIIDSLSHTLAVTKAVEKTYLVNGLVHSPKEIYDKNLFTDIEDRRYSREVLELGKDPEIVKFFQDVFVDDPALSKVNIPEMMDFFRVQVQSDTSGGYSLGFKSLFALPKFVYIFILIWLLFSLALLGLIIRKIRDGIRDAPTILLLCLAIVSMVLSVTMVYGLFSANLWSIWEVLSQYIFSPYTYGFALLFLLFGGYLIFMWIVKDKKTANLGNLSVALFLLLLGGYMVLLPTGLHTGNEQAIYDLQVQGVSNLLTQGANYVLTFQDPSGASALQVANESGSTARTLFLLSLFLLFISILYFTFRKKKV